MFSTLGPRVESGDPSDQLGPRLRGLLFWWGVDRGAGVRGERGREEGRQRGREARREGEGSGERGGGKREERGREAGIGHPPVHPHYFQYCHMGFIV